MRVTTHREAWSVRRHTARSVMTVHHARTARTQRSTRPPGAPRVCSRKCKYLRKELCEKILGNYGESRSVAQRIGRLLAVPL
jgi:hypothetical protein